MRKFLVYTRTMSNEFKIGSKNLELEFKNIESSIARLKRQLKYERNKKHAEVYGRRLEAKQEVRKQILEKMKLSIK